MDPKELAKRISYAGRDPKNIVANVVATSEPSTKPFNYASFKAKLNKALQPLGKKNSQNVAKGGKRTLRKRKGKKGTRKH
jgi:hypothetical protein